MKTLIKIAAGIVTVALLLLTIYCGVLVWFCTKLGGPCSGFWE